MAHDGAPRSLALPDWAALQTLAHALVARSADHYPGWGDLVIFAAAPAARIGKVSGCRAVDIDTKRWFWTVRRQTATSVGGLRDKGTKGKRARGVPLIPMVRPLLERRVALATARPDSRLFVGPRGGRVSTAILPDATHAPTARGHHHRLRREGLRRGHDIRAGG